MSQLRKKFKTFTRSGSLLIFKIIMRRSPPFPFQGLTDKKVMFPWIRSKLLSKKIRRG